MKKGVFWICRESCHKFKHQLLISWRLMDNLLFFPCISFSFQQTDVTTSPPETCMAPSAGQTLARENHACCPAPSSCLGLRPPGQFPGALLHQTALQFGPSRTLQHVRMSRKRLKGCRTSQRSVGKVKISCQLHTTSQAKKKKKIRLDRLLILFFKIAWTVV